MEVNTRKEGDFTVVVVAGEVDLYSSPRMREALLASATRKQARTVVDLAGVTYMDSSGIATLVEALQATKKNSGRLVVAGLAPRVREVFELMNLQTVFELAPDVAAALSGGPAK